MPTYDYECSSCGATTEIVHSIHGGTPVACPACGAEGTLRKRINAPTIHFKGSGWAKKDRSTAHPKPAKATDSPVADGSGAAPAGSGRGAGGGAGGAEANGSSSSGSDGPKDAGKTSEPTGPKTGAAAASAAGTAD